MEQVYLCGNIAAKPLYMKELGIYVYSAEELSYVICHDSLLIEESFFGEELKSFLRDEMNLPGIAEKLERYYTSPQDKDSALVMLLREIGYYSEAEITRFMEGQARQKRLGMADRLREKGDLLMEKKRYESAIRAYGSVLSQRREFRISAKTCGVILQHMGVAYLRMGYAEEAMECIQAAWNETHEEQYLEQMYELCAQKELPFPAELENITGEQIRSWEDRYIRTEEKNQSSSERAQIIRRLESIHGDDAESKRKKEIERFLASEKKRYCGMALV